MEGMPQGFEKGGVLLAGFVNPLLYIFDLEEWDAEGTMTVRYKILYSDIGQLPPACWRRGSRRRKPWNSATPSTT